MFRGVWLVALWQLGAVDPPATNSEEQSFASSSEVRRLTERGRFQEALPLAQRNLATIERDHRPEDPEVAEALSLVGAIQIALSDYQAAQSNLARAVTIQEKRGIESANSRQFYGKALFANGRYGAAEKQFKEALTFAGGAKSNSKVVASVLEDLADVYAKSGDHLLAERHLRRSLEIREAVFGPDSLEIARGREALGLIYADRKMFELAEPLLQRVLEIRRKHLGPEAPAVAKALVNLGTLYIRMEDGSRGEKLVRRGLEISKKTTGPKSLAVAGSLGSLGMLEANRGHLTTAEQLIRESLEIQISRVGPDHPDVIASKRSLAFVHRLRGDDTRAEGELQEALSSTEKVLGRDHVQAALLLHDLAMLDRKKGRVSDAVARLSRALTIQERTTDADLVMGNERDRQALIEGLQQAADVAVALQAQLASVDRAALEFAFRTVLQAKGKLLDSSVATRAALEDHLEARELDMLDELGKARGRLARAALAGPAGSKGAHEAELASLQRRAEEVERDIAARSSRFRTSRAPATVAAIAAKMPSDGALVELVRYTRREPGAELPPGRAVVRYGAFVLRPNSSLRWVDLGDSEPIDGLAKKVRETLAARAPYQAAARELDELLMRPIRARVGSVRHILLAPDGQLHLVPFAALVDESGRHLIERFEVSYLGSGRDLTNLQRRRNRPGPPVVIANPDFGAEPAEPSADINRPVGVFRSMGNAEEGGAVASFLSNARLLTGPEATETRVKQLKSPRVLHVVTHGFFLPEGGPRPSNPLLRSGLALADANLKTTAGEDGWLTALEAGSINLWGTKLVVLSACETGLGTVHDGEGVYGLRRAFSQAGAETVVMSLWRVRDSATRKLMINYYRGLRLHAGRSQALRNAQLAMLRDPKRSHPFFWAAFIVAGNWTPLE